MSTASKEYFKDDEKEARSTFPIWDCGSPLYDSCELVSLSHMIERHMMVAWPCTGGSKQIITQLSGPEHEVIISAVNAKSSSKLTGLSEFFEKIIMWKRKGKKHKKIQTGGLSGFYNRLVCGGNRELT